MRIGEIIRAKPEQDVVTISPDAGVRELLAKLSEHNIGALIVSRDGSSLDGIVSERDVVRRLHSDGDSLLDETVADIMTSEVHTCQPSEAVVDMARAMTERRIRHVPVLSEDGRLVGIVSIGDIVKQRIDELTDERDQLTAYITR